MIIFDEALNKWVDGTVRGAKGRGIYEVQPSNAIEPRLVPMKHVMRPSEGGIGAVLYETARRGSYALLDALLKGGVSPFECDTKGNTALHYAVRRGHAAMCKRLITAGADAEVANMAGTSAWDLALQCGHAAVRRIFSPSVSDRDLSKPPRAAEETLTVSRSRDKGAAPLLLAAWKGDFESANSAIKKNPTLVDERWKSGAVTALMLASRQGYLNIVQALLKASASMDVRSRRGSSALSMAAEEGHTDVIFALLAAGAEVDVADEDGYTALGIACENGHADAATALLKAKSDPNLPRKNGWTSLITASYNGYSAVVKVLMEGGAQANLAKENGYNAVIAAAYNGFDEVVTTLVDCKAEPDRPMKNGWNALMVAAAQGHAATVAVLCELGANVDYARPANGFSVLMASVTLAPDDSCASVELELPRALGSLRRLKFSAALGTDAGGVALDAADIDARAEAGLEDGARALEQVLFEAALLGSPTLEP